MAHEAAHYREHPLHPRLAGHVEAAWSVTLAPGGASVAHPVLPDGCIDIVLLPGAAPVVVGPMTRASHAPLAPGQTVRGLRFRPGAAATTLGLDADALLDLEVPLAELWPADGATAEPLRLDGLQRLVAARLQPADPIVGAAVAALEQAPGTDVRSVAAHVALSERQLRRRFHATVGYGPKRLGRVLRLQRLLTEARRAPEAGGAALAVAAGYADQAHMARETRELTGTAPGALLAGRGRSVQDPDR